MSQHRLHCIRCPILDWAKVWEVGGKCVGVCGKCVGVCGGVGLRVKGLGSRI